MSTMIGSDVDELRALAAELDTRAATLRSVEVQLTWRIHGAPWQGGDVERFRHDWHDRHRRAITISAAGIDEAARVLRANADQQELASAAGFTGRVPAVGRFDGAGAVGGAVSGDGDGWIAAHLAATASVSARVISAGTTVADSVITGIEDIPLAARSEDLVADFLHATEKPLTALGHVGRWLGPVGLVFDANELRDDLGSGDGWGAALSGASLGVGGLATMAAFGLGGAAIVGAAPALAVGAAVVGVASLVYHERDVIRGVVTGAGDAAVRAGEWAADRARDVAGGLARSATDAGKRFVDGIFGKPAWAPW